MSDINLSQASNSSILDIFLTQPWKEKRSVLLLPKTITLNTLLKHLQKIIFNSFFNWFIFFRRYSNSLIDSAIMIFFSSFWSRPQLRAWARVREKQIVPSPLCGSLHGVLLVTFD